MNWQLLLKAEKPTTVDEQKINAIRNITASEVNALVRVRGIVVSCSKSGVKATSITLRCRKCGHDETLHPREG